MSSSATTTTPTTATNNGTLQIQRPIPRPLIRRLLPPAKLATTSTGAVGATQVSAAATATNTPKVAVPTRIPVLPKKRTIQLLSDTADALKRVEAGEAKRLAPTPVRESTTGFIPPPVQSGGQTPAARAIRNSQAAIDALRQADYNKINSVVFLYKRLHHDMVGAVVAETALDLARSGRF